jgi:Flp pilus assembly protein TadG
MFRNVISLFRNRRANVAIIFALAMVPLVYLVGMGVDYTNAVDRKTQLDADADAAALAAVSPAMLAQQDPASVTAAQNTFNAQATTVYGVNYNPGNQLTVNVQDSLTGRTVTVTYNASSQNAFPNVLGQTTIPITGTSQAVGALPPNIDFYLLLDSSPSMAIAATQNDINTMVNNTPSQGGCGFGCHESHPSSDNLGNPGGVDNYQLARNLGVTLRIDLLNQAAQNLMTTAQTTENANHAAYRMAVYSFDNGHTKLLALTNNLATAKTSAANLQMLTVYANNWLTSGNQNSDTDTDYDGAMTYINGQMPAPGNGTNAQGDKPQEVLFFVTDGVEDESVSGNRQQSVMSNGWCDTIKNRGIRIAVLYTEYLPLPTNAWYNTWISPFQSNIEPTLQSCASPGLYNKVQTGGDISAALSRLFQLAVATAHLSQ